MALLTIMIPTIDSRAALLKRLTDELSRQIGGYDIKIDVLHEYQEASIGFRRNILLQRADSDYVCFFDDDDMPTSVYVESILKGIQSHRDCCSLKGIYTVNGLNPEIFEHSIVYDAWKTNEGAIYPQVKYERPPNHLNCIKAEIAKQFSFLDLSHGEDSDWSNRINESKIIKTELTLEEPIYNYLKIS